MSKVNETNPVDFCPICSTHQEQVTSQILRILQKRSLPKNCIIFDQDQGANGIYLIRSGSVKLSRFSPQGREILIELLPAGRTFGENSIFGNGSGDTATTTENCELFFLPKLAFREALQNHPELYGSIITTLCQSMDRLNSIIENINTPSARERVTSYLKKLQSDQHNTLVRLTGKKHEVALMLGLRPETFSRTLADLEAAHIIQMNHRQIQILTPDRL